MTEQKKEWIRLAVRYAILFFLAGTLFLVMALTVFSLRNESAGTWTMPNVSGSYFTDVHNELSRMNLRIEIDKEYFPDRPQGIILTQSVLPGETVHSRDKVVLTVNAYRAILDVPDFKGAPFATASSTLQRVTKDDQVYALQTGVVSFVYDETLPDGTVIDQFPPGGARVAPGASVDFLVASRKDEVKKAFQDRQSLPVEQLKGARIDAVSGYLMRTGLDYRIVKIEDTQDEAQNGVVSEVVRKDNHVELTVKHRKPSERFLEGYERLTKNIGPAQNCEAALIDPKNQEDRHVFWKSPGLTEELNLVFFRMGERRLEVQCGGDVVFKKKFTPDYPG